MKRPHISLKLATSLDGKIALANGRSEWITSEKSRQAGRALRAQHDGIAIGANTAVLDNPQLTTRTGDAPDPVRIIFDSQCRLSPLSNLAATAKDVPVWLFCDVEHQIKGDEIKQKGVRIFPVKHIEDGLDISVALDLLKSNGIERLLIEGGGQLAASFIKQNYIDEIHWFRAPIILGGDGRNGVGSLGLERLSHGLKLSPIVTQNLGDDTYVHYEMVRA